MKYGADHRARRRVLLPNAWGRPCPRCGQVMLWSDELDLDHGDPDGRYAGIAHAVCNRRAGGRLGRHRQVAAAAADRGRRRMGIVVCVLGVEISEDRRHAAVGMAARRAGEEVVLVELAACLDGTAAVVAEVVRLHADLPVAGVVVDPHSQAATLLQPLAAAKIGVARPSTSDVVVAHGRFLDELAAGRLRHVAHPRLDEAARAGEQRRLAGAQTWDRRAAVDISPLTAVTLALWGLLELPGPRPELVVV